MPAEFDPAEYFGPEGRLSRAIPGFEHRPQQAAMARRVWDSLDGGGKLAIEAGTGVGKSLAYLIPSAIWAAGNKRRVIISTYTRLLQSQLITKDFELACRVLDAAPRAAVAYGQDNYICRFRLEMQTARGLFDSRDEAGAAGRLIDWADSSEDGIILNYPDTVPPALQRRVARDSAACRRDRCPYRKTCFYLRARRDWEQAGIVVTNHSLYFASLVGSLDLLPEHHAVIFDEAHRLEDACVRHFGADVGSHQLEQLLSDISGTGKTGLAALLPAKSTLKSDIRSAVASVRAEAEKFFADTEARLPKDKDRMRLLEALDTEAPGQAVAKLAELIDEAAPDLDDDMLSAELAGAARKLRAVSGAFAAFAKHDTENTVYWADRPVPDRLTLIAAPLNVAPMLKAHVYDRELPTVLTSATLTVAGSFTFFESRLGLEGFAQVRLDSPFDYAAHSLVFVPPRLPPPTGPDFAKAAAQTIAGIIEHTRGRALVLFTSYDSLNTIYGLMPAGQYTFLCQGDLPLPRLLAQFQEDTSSVLFATQSFWQGVDVPGEALSGLIICRLPFEVPDEPRLVAISEQLKRDGQKPFPSYQLPTAVLRFRQGFGRLIRTATDRGIVAILDRRIVDKHYGRVFLNSLPKDIPLTTKLADIQSFFAEES